MNSVLTGNVAAKRGGGIRAKSGSVRIENTEISDNQAKYGGGLSLSNQGTTAELYDCSLFDNTPTPFSAESGSQISVYESEGSNEELDAAFAELGLGEWFDDLF